MLTTKLFLALTGVSNAALSASGDDAAKQPAVRAGNRKLAQKMPANHVGHSIGRRPKNSLQGS